MIYLREKRFGVHYGFITFVKHFKYIGSWIYLSLRDDFDVESRLASTKYAIGSIQNFLYDDHVNLHRNYLILLATPVNILP